MALRLTGISTPADAAGAPAGVALPGPGLTESGGAFGARLGIQARTHLTANDLDSYKALFARAGEHDDPHARYHARVRLIEEGLAAAGARRLDHPGDAAVRCRRRRRDRGARS